MPTTLGFKDIIDLPKWRQLSYAPVVDAAGTTMISDYRNSEDRHPEIFYLASSVLLWKYNVKNDEWIQVPSPALAGTFGAGANGVFCPSQGPSGTIGAGGTTTSILLTTALPAAVGQNQLANRGDGRGFKIRIIGLSAGGSGKTEEKVIVGNTAGVNPTIYLDSALTFAPANGDRYEMLSGRVYLLGAGTTAAGTWRYYDIATNFFATVSEVNLPATISIDSKLVATDELYVPADKNPGDGFFGNLIATASGAASITGQAALGDAVIVANEYRNHQIRIVQDVAIPTAVGQRRRIVSHTAGASPVYTVTAWAVTPSATCTYVVENWSDNIIGWITAVTTTFNYTISTNTWDTVTWAVRPSVLALGIMAWKSDSTLYDIRHQARHSYIFSPRGTVSTIDLFDLAGAATGLWTANINYGNKLTAFATGSCCVPAKATNQGRYAYINVSGTQRFVRFDMYNWELESWCYLPLLQGAATVGRSMAITTFIDGMTKLSFVMHLMSTLQIFVSVADQR